MVENNNIIYPDNPQVDSGQEPSAYEPPPRIVPGSYRRVWPWQKIAIISGTIFIVGLLGFYLFNDPYDEETASPDEISVNSSNLEESGSYESAIGEYDEAISRASGNEKAALLSAQALIAMRNESYEEALNYAMAADEVESSGDTLSLIGAIARKKGDKGMALEYYHKALNAYRSEEVRNVAEESEVQRIIVEIREGQ